MENIILKNMKIKTIMENMRNTLEEMKNYVKQIIKEELEKEILAYLKKKGFHKNQISRSPSF
jgi:ribosomal protein S20